jgi:hypothetical protein
MIQSDQQSQFKHAIRVLNNFRIHFLVYLLVIGFCWMIWLLEGSLKNIYAWPLYPSMIWGIGLFIHWLMAFRVFRKNK